MAVDGSERLAYGTAEAAELMGLSERTIRNMCQAGELKARRYGAKWIIPRRSILAWLDGAEGVPPPAEPEPVRSDPGIIRLLK